MVCFMRVGAKGQIPTVLRPRARLRVILHAERGAVGQLQAAEAAVEQADVGGPGIAGRLSASTAKPWFRLVISTRPSARRLTGWLAPRWPWCIFEVRAPTARPSNWWPRQMPNERLAGLQHLRDHRHRIFPGRGGIAGAVGEEEAVGLVRHHLIEGRRGGQHGHAGAGIGEVAEDVALRAIIDGDDVGSASSWRASS